MESYIFPIFLVLALSVLISPKFVQWQRKRIILIKWIVTIVSITFYSIWFFVSSFSEKPIEAYSVEIVNKLPQSIDFYLIKMSENQEKRNHKVIHSGKIRPQHYRLEQFDMEGFNELWLVGFLGKDNLVYYSQHAIPNKNVDAVMEVSNYMITSRTLSEKAKKWVGYHIQDNYRLGAYISLSFLFILINLITLPQKNLKS